MGQLFANNAETVLAAALTNVATTLSVTPGTGNEFPSIAALGADYFLLTLFKITGGVEASHEIVKVTVRAAGTPDTMTIVRAQEGTTALAFASGDRAELRLTKGTLENKSDIAHVHAASAVTYAGSTNLVATNVDAALDELATALANIGTAATRDVTTSPTDMTAGRVLKVGDFGVGEAVLLPAGVNLNTVVNSGFYRLNGSHVNAPAAVGYGQLIVSRGGDTIAQIVTGHIDGEIYWRQGNPPDVGGPGSWSAWYRFFHSGNLGAATESIAGLVELATAAEAQALASTTVALTPARLADAFKGASQSLVGNGYQKLPGGLIIQWGRTGTIAADTEVTVTYPIAFPNAALNVTATLGGVNSRINGKAIVFSATLGTTSVVLSNDQDTGGAGLSAQIFWTAIGY